MSEVIGDELWGTETKHPNKDWSFLPHITPDKEYQENRLKDGLWMYPGEQVRIVKFVRAESTDVTDTVKRKV